MAKQVHLALTTISTVLGLALLTSSSIYLEALVKDPRSTRGFYCEGHKADCQRQIRQAHKAGLAATSLEVVASMTQIIFGLIFFTSIRKFNHKLWMGVHFVVFLLALIAFTLKLHFKELGGVAIVFSGLDWIFCFVAPFVLYNLVKTKYECTKEETESLAH